MFSGFYLLCYENELKETLLSIGLVALMKLVPIISSFTRVSFVRFIILCQFLVLPLLVASAYLICSPVCFYN